MKKRVLRERRLNRQRIVEKEEDKTVVELTRAALMKKAKGMGLEVNSRMTKADLEKLIKEA